MNACFAQKKSNLILKYDVKILYADRAEHHWHEKVVYHISSITKPNFTLDKNKNIWNSSTLKYIHLLKCHFDLIFFLEGLSNTILLTTGT